MLNSAGSKAFLQISKILVFLFSFCLKLVDLMNYYSSQSLEKVSSSILRFPCFYRRVELQKHASEMTTQVPPNYTHVAARLM